MASIKATVQAILLEKRKMKASEASEGMKDLMSGKTTPAQAAAFLTALQVINDCILGKKYYFAESRLIAAYLHDTL